MASASLLGLPDEIIELILTCYLHGLEISVRYTRRRINTPNHQDGAVLLLVCKFIHHIAKPILFETVIFGHHASHLLRNPADPFSLVLAPASLPMDKFVHVCFDLEYALNLVKSDGLWPWSKMRYLRLVDYHSHEQNVGGLEVEQEYHVSMKLQEICGMRGVQFTNCLLLGHDGDY